MVTAITATTAIRKSRRKWSMDVLTARGWSATRAISTSGGSLALTRAIASSTSFPYRVMSLPGAISRERIMAGSPLRRTQESLSR